MSITGYPAKFISWDIKRLPKLEEMLAVRRIR
jgi:hypothetical protein